MITFQFYRSNIFHLLVIFFAFVSYQNLFCAYADFKQDGNHNGVNIAEPEPVELDGVAPQVQNASRPNSITWYVGLHQPNQQRRYDIELYPTKKSCCALLGLVTFITIMALRLRSMYPDQSDQPAPSIWQEDGCPVGCISAFNASGALVNTTQRSYGSWSPLIIGCNGDTSAYSQWCLTGLHFCMKPINSCTSPNARFPMPIGLREKWCWNPANVTKEKMIAQVSSFCKTTDHIAFCHCENDPEEGSCTVDPLRIANILPKDSFCKKPESSNQKANNFEKMKMRDRLKELLKIQKMSRSRNAFVVHTKNNAGKHALKQPRQRSKR